MKASLFSALVLSTFLFAACSTAVEAPEEMMESEEDTGVTNVEVQIIEDEVMEDEGASEEAAAVSPFLAYDANSYQEALDAGKTVFLDFHADWCPTCVSNAPKIESAFEQLGDEDVVGFKVNYDSEKDFALSLGVKSQSILLVIPGGDVASARQNAGGLVTADEVIEFIRG